MKNGISRKLEKDNQVQEIVKYKMVGIKSTCPKGFWGFLLPILISENLFEKAKLWYNCK